MPSLSRRRECDGRGDRLESEVRQSEMISPEFASKRKFMCGKCHTLFEERSRTCPRCESGRTMGELKPMFVTEAERRRSVERARDRRGARLPGQGI